MSTDSPESKIVRQLTLEWSKESRSDILAAAKSQHICRRIVVFFFCAVGLSVIALVSHGLAVYAHKFPFSDDKYLLMLIAQNLGSGVTLLTPRRLRLSLPCAFFVIAPLQIACGFTLENYTVLISIRIAIGYIQCQLYTLMLTLASEWFNFDCTTVVITLLNAIGTCSFPLALAMKNYGLSIEHFFIVSGALCAALSIISLIMQRVNFRFALEINETIDSVVVENKKEATPKSSVSWGIRILSFLTFMTFPLILWIGQIAIIMFDEIENVIAQKEYIRLISAPVVGFLMDQFRRNAFVFGFANFVMSILLLLLAISITPMQVLLLSGVFETMMLTSLYSIPVDLKEDTNVVLFQMNAWSYIGTAVVFMAFVYWGLHLIVGSYLVCAMTAIILATCVPESNKSLGVKLHEKQQSVNLYEMVKVASPIKNPGSPLRNKIEIKI